MFLPPIHRHLGARLRRCSAPRAVALVLGALIVSGGSAEAARKIYGRDIAVGTVTGRNVKDGSLEHKDLDAAAVVRLRGMQGPIGDPGSRGETGVPGPAGPAGVIGPAGPQGARGARGATGSRGYTGSRGPRGYSAYETWLDEGNAGDEADFLASLRGPAAAVLHAQVAADGTLLAGGHVVPAGVVHASPGAGVYTVAFDRAVDTCAPQVTGRGPQAALFTATAPGGDPAVVEVRAFTPAGEPADAGFSLALACG